MLLKSILLALSLGYVICVIAKKQEGLLKSLGYTIGISILTLTLLYGFMMAGTNCLMKGKPSCGMKGQMMKAGHHQMMKR